MIIEADGLTKKFNKKVVAVDQISFEVAEGEIYGFLGPNGAGKTTTINMLTTMMKPTGGSGRVCGYDITTAPNKVRGVIGLVPQDLTVDDDLTGIDNLRLQAKLYHVPWEEASKKIEELLELVDLKEAAGRLVSTYSGGMRKRLELIEGLIHSPRVLFLDEPTLGLDVQTRLRIWEYIKALNRDRGLTIFLTTHYMEEADYLCGKIGIIDHGKIVKTGSPGELKDSLGGDIIEIETDRDSPDILDHFKTLPFIKEAKRSSDLYRLKVSKGEEALPRIFEKLNHSSIKVKRVALTKPSLDQVFVEYTGKSLRDAQEGAEDPVKSYFRFQRLRQ